MEGQLDEVWLREGSWSKRAQSCWLSTSIDCTVSVWHKWTHFPSRVSTVLKYSFWKFPIIVNYIQSYRTGVTGKTTLFHPINHSKTASPITDLRPVPPMRGNWYESAALGAGNLATRSKSLTYILHVSWTLTDYRLYLGHVRKGDKRRVITSLMDGVKMNIDERLSLSYWVHENKTRWDFNTKKTSVMKYVTGTIVLYLTETHKMQKQCFLKCFN